MAGSRSYMLIAGSSSVPDTTEGREFFQDRLGIFALWIALLSVLFLPLRLGLEAGFAPTFRWRDVLWAPGIAPHLSATGTAVVLWLATRSARTLSIRTLLLCDTLAVIVIGTGFALMGAQLATGGGLIDDPAVAMLTATLAVAFTMMFRAVVVPTTPRRTAVVTALAVLPLILADIVTLGAAGLSNPADVAASAFSTMWALMIIAIAAVASEVVFGLRREVQRVRRLGQYTLEQKIGEGAMGVVYRARHALLRRPTAIKLLPPERAGQRNVQRFEREVQLTAALTHPNTVAIYDYGHTPDGTFYYAMELLDGINLENLVRRYGAQPAGRVNYILRQVCRALAEAHGLGVIHRDIKPANIILSVRGGEPDVAKVVDFGLVKAFEQNEDAVTMSMEGDAVLAGTPLYFSPEAIVSPEHVDGRSDLYALGSVAYYLLTGQPLFEGRTVMEVCAHHLHTRPVQPSVRAGFAIEPALEALVMQCLAKSPDDRPASAMALHDALARCGSASAWTAADAQAWWARFQSAGPAAEEMTTATDSVRETVAVDLRTR
jgi:eukaryotic-like serine/threonine-protein kinase